VTADSWRSIKLVIDGCCDVDASSFESSFTSSFKLADESLDKVSGVCGAACADASPKADKTVDKVESAASTARQENELWKAFDITPQTNYMSDEYANLKYCGDLDTVYSIQIILIKLGVAIAFCIADYKGNGRAIASPVAGIVARRLIICLI
jgi:hypothetical protein